MKLEGHLNLLEVRVRVLTTIELLMLMISFTIHLTNVIVATQEKLNKVVACVTTINLVYPNRV
jgi:hypothetical protein